MTSNPLVTKLLCVALVVCLVIPAGRAAFPVLAGSIDRLEFSAIEAVTSATLGFGLYAAFFG
jgi:hypothetical protein